MAMGMAMTRRRLLQIDKLMRLRDQFRRKLEAKYGKSIVPESNGGHVSDSSPNPVKTSLAESGYLPSPENIELKASQLMEDLYQTEVLDKQEKKKEIAAKVDDLMELLYREQQQSRRFKRKSPMGSGLKRVSTVYDPVFEEIENRQRCDVSSQVVFKSSIVGLAFVDLWTKILENEGRWDDEKVQFLMCKCLEKSQEFGPVAFKVASSIARHVIFLLNNEEGRSLSNTTRGQCKA